MHNQNKTRNLGPMIRLYFPITNGSGGFVLIAWGFVVAMAVALSVGGMIVSFPFFMGFSLALMYTWFFVEDKGSMPLLYSTLPTNRRTVLASRFIVAISALLAMAVIMIPCVLVATIFNDDGAPKEMTIAIASLLANAIILAILIPILTLAKKSKNGSVSLIPIVSALLLISLAAAGVWLFQEQPARLSGCRPLAGTPLVRRTWQG